MSPVDMPYRSAAHVILQQGAAVVLTTCADWFIAFKPKKVPEGTKQWQLKQYAQQTLVSTCIRSLACSPELLSADSRLSGPSEIDVNRM